MVKKDWKRQQKGSDSTLTQWFNDKTRESVFVYKQTFVPQLKKKSFWVFEVSTSTRTIKEVMTKTHAIAVKKAMAYMRTH